MEAVIYGLIAAVVIPVALHFGAKHKRKRLLLYLEVAGNYPGSSVTDGGFWKRHELHITHNGARINVWVWATKNSRGTVWKARLPRVPEFRVYREGVGSAFGKSVFGTQDIEVGAHRGFDEHFMVKGDDPPLLRRAWSRETCELMLSRFPNGRVVANGADVTLTEYRIVETASEIENGLELIGNFAACDLYGVAALRELEAATFHDGRPPYVIVRGPANIQIGPVTSPDGTVTRAVCPAGTRDEPPAPQRLEAIGASFSREGKQLHITWPGIETSTERLAGAIEILRELSRAPSAGVFR